MIKDPQYVMVDAPPVTLAGTTYTVQRQEYDDRPGHEMVWLTGPRGAVYFLRPYNERNGDSGLRQVISWKSGTELRKRGNEVRVTYLAGVIEQYVPAHRSTY